MLCFCYEQISAKCICVTNSSLATGEKPTKTFHHKWKFNMLRKQLLNMRSEKSKY